MKNQSWLIKNSILSDYIPFEFYYFQTIQQSIQYSEILVLSKKCVFNFTKHTRPIVTIRCGHAKSINYNSKGWRC